MAKEFLTKNSFWLSLLLHLLVLLWLVTAVFRQPPPPLEQKEKAPHYYVPAYTYTGSIKPAISHFAQASTHSVQADYEKQTSTKNRSRSNKADNRETPIPPPRSQETQNTVRIPKNKTKPLYSKKQHRAQQSMLLTSLNMLKQDQLEAISHTGEAEPIYLVGDDNSPADPLIKLMGRSLSAHFHYPRTAGELGIKGKVLIALTLHPEGHYSNIELIKSSSNQDLDAAALYAVNSAPLVFGADRYLTKPRRFIVGFVFY